MGGRGTFASGINVPFTFETVEEYEGVEVIRGIGTQTGMPEESNSSTMYMQFHKDGRFKILRIYDENHRLTTEFAYHRERNLSDNNEPVLHVHYYDTEHFRHGEAQFVTKEEFQNYKKYFKGATDNVKFRS